jgi:hypothetical protein
MSPPRDPAADLIVVEAVPDVVVADTAAPLFGIALGLVVMVVLALNALAY